MNRKFTSLFLAFTSLFVLVTGVALYFTKGAYLMSFHLVMGVAMTIYCVIHVVYNIKPLKNYIKSVKSAAQPVVRKLSKEFVAMVLVGGVFTVGSVAYAEVLKEKFKNRGKGQGHMAQIENTADAPYELTSQAYEIQIK